MLTLRIGLSSPPSHTCLTGQVNLHSSQRAPSVAVDALENLLPPALVPPHWSACGARRDLSRSRIPTADVHNSSDATDPEPSRLRALACLLLNQCGSYLQSGADGSRISCTCAHAAKALSDGALRGEGEALTELVGQPERTIDNN